MKAFDSWYILSEVKKDAENQTGSLIALLRHLCWCSIAFLVKSNQTTGSGCLIISIIADIYKYPDRKGYPDVGSLLVKIVYFSQNLNLNLGK